MCGSNYECTFFADDAARGIKTCTVCADRCPAVQNQF